MLKKIIGIFLLSSHYGLAQINLVPNHSFEETTGCYNETAGIYHVVNEWKIYSYNTADYFNPCNNIYPQPNYGVPTNVFGYQNAKEGLAYGCVNTFCFCSALSRDYLVVELADTLTKGIPYLIKYYVSPADKNQFAVNNIGLYLSFEPPNFSPSNLYSQTPQIINRNENILVDTSAWIMIADTFISNLGGEKYISIGNFFNDNNTDTVIIGDGITTANRADYYVDDVWVTPLDTTIGVNENRTIKMSVYPNPNSGVFTLQLEQPLTTDLSINLNDIHGRKIFERRGEKGQNEIPITTSNIAPGVYTICINFENGLSLWQKVVISY